MGDLSKNFDSSEWVCHCGCEQKIVHDALINMAQKLRDYLEKPIVVHCVNRCVQHNANVGGVKNSLHIKGMAVDCHTKGLPIKKLHRIVKKLHEKKVILTGGLGYYDWGIHFDIGPHRYWGKKPFF